jgi:hypothetical protein
MGDINTEFLADSRVCSFVYIIDETTIMKYG